MRMRKAGSMGRIIRKGERRRIFRQERTRITIYGWWKPTAMLVMKLR
jgi:hypothetical protein